MRLALVEQLRPLSLHIGVLRATMDDVPVMDILFDTSDSDRHLEASASIAFAEHVPWVLERFRELIGEDLRLGSVLRGW